MVKLLLSEADLDINLDQRQNGTALVAALDQEHFQIVEMMIKTERLDLDQLHGESFVI